jgi:zinc transport system substrate-binding protein
MSTRSLLSALAALAVLALSACGSGHAGSDGPGRLQVVAAFYPLQYAVEMIGGAQVEVASLTKPGGEPHDVELTPRQVGRVAQADLVVYERGFQPAVDAAVSREAANHSLDVSHAARLEPLAAHGVDAHEQDSAQQSGSHGTLDPHFWLDPQRYADVGDAVARALAARDPAHAAAYQARAAGFRENLGVLDAELATGLAHCAVHELVTSHAAFGYLAERYGMHQEGISGLDPEAEPDPATLARVVDHIRRTGATTVYAETLASPAVASTVARETGARLAVLDPLEGITDQSAGTDYPSVMRANLTALRAGQECR